MTGTVTDENGKKVRIVFIQLPKGCKDCIFNNGDGGIEDEECCTNGLLACTGGYWELAKGGEE